MSKDSYREQFREEVIPAWYSALVQKIFISLVGILSLCMVLFLKPSLTLVLSFFFYHHLFIYLLHKYALHRKVPGLNWAYIMHVQHHRFYLGEKMKPVKKNDEYMLLMPYHAVLGYLLLSLPGHLLLLLPFGSEGILSSFAVVGIYYFFYEWIHYISHLDEKSRLSKIPGMRYMQKYHLVHHHPLHKDSKHFDITFPLFDFLLSTFLSRSKN